MAKICAVSLLFLLLRTLAAFSSTDNSLTSRPQDGEKCARSISSYQVLPQVNPSDEVSLVQVSLLKTERRDARLVQAQNATAAVNARSNASTSVNSTQALAVNASATLHASSATAASATSGATATLGTVAKQAAAPASQVDSDSDMVPINPAPMQPMGPMGAMVASQFGSMMQNSMPRMMPPAATMPLLQNMMPGPEDMSRLANVDTITPLMDPAPNPTRNYNLGPYMDLNAASTQQFYNTALASAGDEAELQTPFDGVLVHDQNYQVTAHNRYPALFQGVKELLKNAKPGDVKLMSFGCSDGSEVRTLRHYFPDAAIHGVDIDAQLIATNNAMNNDAHIRYYSSTSNLKKESYDAAFALSILCRQMSMTDHLPYGHFLETLQQIDSMVKKDGYIVLYNSDFPFTEYPYAYRFKNVASGCDAGEHFTELLSGKATIVSADQRPPEGYPVGAGGGTGQPTGDCSPHHGQYCLETGWRWKFSYKGDMLQPHGNNFYTFGCMHPGPFFRKMQTIPNKELLQTPPLPDDVEQVQPPGTGINLNIRGMNHLKPIWGVQKDAELAAMRQPMQPPQVSLLQGAAQTDDDDINALQWGAPQGWSAPQTARSFQSAVAADYRAAPE